CRAETVFTMLAHDDAIESVALNNVGIIKRMRAGVIHISSSTVSVALAERLTTEHEKARQGFVAAPVFGRPDVAAAGNLFVVAAGARSAIEAVGPLLDAVGQKTFVVSETPKAANL